MNIRKIFFFSILFAIIALVGCSNEDNESSKNNTSNQDSQSNQEYDDAMEQGMKAVDAEQFEDAVDYFEAALTEKPDDDSATIAIEQLQLIIKSIEVAMDEDLSEAVSLLEKASQQEQGPETVTNKANELLANFEDADQQLHKINDFIKNKDFEQALNLVDESLEKNDAKKYMQSFETQLSSLEKDIKKAKLFTYIKGYSINENDGSAICQITEEDIMCGVLSVDLLSYEEIKSIELQSDDALKLAFADESDLLISNINEDSFDMLGRIFKKTTANDIENHPANYQTVNDYFNRETFTAILSSAPGDHNLFNFLGLGQPNSENNTNEATKEDVQSKLDSYSNEEIEYARIWLDYVNGPNPPKLTVIFDKKGTPITPYLEDDSIVYPEDVTVLLGEFTADGLVTYSSNRNGTINVYDVPAHWHQQSDEEMLEATEDVLKTITTKEVPLGNDDQVLKILETMIIDR